VKIWLALAALAVVACDAPDKDTPEVAARKAECKKLLAHIFELSPQSKASGKSTQELVDAVPIEDIEQCGAAHPEVVACMQAAVDLDTVHACVPVTIECKANDKTRVRDDKRPIYEIVGDCKTVEIAASRIMVLGKAADTLIVTGSDDSIRIDTAKSIMASGARNHITWKLGKDTPPPQVVDKGTKNTLTGVE